jgi:c-di-GMP-related signal transduction protein
VTTATPHAPGSPRVLFARQAIMDRRGRPAGYELLYRGPPEATVLELLEDATPSPALLDRLRALRAQGFRVALDDFAPGRRPPRCSRSPTSSRSICARTRGATPSG